MNVYVCKEDVFYVTMMLLHHVTYCGYRDTNTFAIPGGGIRLTIHSGKLYLAFDVYSQSNIDYMKEVDETFVEELLRIDSCRAMEILSEHKPK